MWLLLFRVVFLTLYTLFTTLLFPGFVIDGKYHLLFFATVSAYWIQLFRLGGHRLPGRQRGMVAALGVVAGIWLAVWLFDGVKMGPVGILCLYLGVVWMETFLPEEATLFTKKTSL
ncbi:MAG TPA: hypothetical protein PLC07_09835 [Bacillota bacterium]|nr:hypothetical protein [Bacillota bacterium]